MLRMRENKTMTPGPSPADLEAARALAERGGPFTPAEFERLNLLSPVERTALRHRTVGASVGPEEREIRAAIAREFGEKRQAAEAALTAAIAERERMTEARFVAQDEVARVSSATWMSDGYANYEAPHGTAAQREAAQARVEDARLDLERARRNEEAARVALSTLGAAENEQRRRLSATGALKK